MKVRFECTYCGHKWVDTRYFTNFSEMSATCPICNDKKVRAKNVDDHVVDGYIGCTPFKEEVDEKEIKLDSPTQDDWYFD